jgi:hypothetical protein
MTRLDHAPRPRHADRANRTTARAAAVRAADETGGR